LSPLVDEIVKERARINEINVGFGRLFFLSFFSVTDLLSYINWIDYAIIRPSPLTIYLDFGFLLFALIVQYTVMFRGNPPALKYFIVTGDFLFLGIMLIYDPSVPRNGEMVYWTSMVGTLFLYYLNILRYSKLTVIYAFFLAVLVFSVTSLHFGRSNLDYLIPMYFPFLVFLSIGYFITVGNKKMVEEINTKMLMERYLAPQLVNEIYKNQNLPTVQKVDVALLFSDIRSFTEISENHSPEDVVQFLNEYLKSMTEIIFEEKGTLDKFIGDGILTIFGAPIKTDADCLHALKCAINMQNSMIGFSKGKLNLRKPLKIGIGLHYGEVIAGNIGSDKRLDYTVIGDTVNIASRIESLTKYYNIPIIASEAFIKTILPETLNTFCVLRELDTVRLVGKNVAIKLYEIIAIT